MERIIYSRHVQPQVVSKLLKRSPEVDSRFNEIDRDEIQRWSARKANSGLLRLLTLQGRRTRLGEFLRQTTNVVHWWLSNDSSILAASSCSKRPCEAHYRNFEGKRRETHMTECHDEKQAPANYWTSANYFESHNSNLIVRCSHGSRATWRCQLCTKGIADCRISKRGKSLSSGPMLGQLSQRLFLPKIKGKAFFQREAEIKWYVRKTEQERKIASERTSKIYICKQRRKRDLFCCVLSPKHYRNLFQSSSVLYRVISIALIVS